MWKNDHEYKEIFTKEDFYKANNITKKYIIETPLTKLTKISERINKPVFIKDESVQNTNSFKQRGISYFVDKIIEEYETKDDLDMLSLVTQSTGNHGISMLCTLYEIAKINKDNKDHLIHKINPVIFASSSIGNIKHDKMKKYLMLFRTEIQDETRGDILTNYQDYAEALIAREEYMKNNESVYITHASNDTMIGHGTMAIEIKKQLTELGYDKNTKICFLAACGAGGPVGIGACLKHIYNHKNITFTIVQTHDQNALICSLLQNKIVYNDEIDFVMPFNYADGIGVDKPEEQVIEAAQSYADIGITVNHYETLMKSKDFIEDLEESYNKDKKNCVAGGSTSAVYLAIEEYQEEKWFKNSDIIIMLGCEGNIDTVINDYIQNL